MPEKLIRQFGRSSVHVGRFTHLTLREWTSTELVLNHIPVIVEKSLIGKLLKATQISLLSLRSKKMTDRLIDGLRQFDPCRDAVKWIGDMTLEEESKWIMKRK